MEIARIRRAGFSLAICGCIFWTIAAPCQQSPDHVEVPTHFKLDQETAARLRPELMAQSVPATGRYATGNSVFAELIAQLDTPKESLRWALRIVENGEFNAYSSPDGSIYVESGLAKLAGTNAGLWSAILAHEIAHVVHRDWARRYLYQQELESASAGDVVLGSSRMPAASWSDGQSASADMGRFCRQMELEADRDSLMLMARAGYHPDFAPALHHLLHAQGDISGSASANAMHPCWEERDRALSRAYVQASIAFERVWPEWYASPGGNPPVVVFTDQPTVRRSRTNQWQILIPMHCENLAGEVEVVLRADPGHSDLQRQGRLRDTADRGTEIRQISGCMSPQTTVVFDVADPGATTSPMRWTDVYILDAAGDVLARTDLPKLPR